MNSFMKKKLFYVAFLANVAIIVFFWAQSSFSLLFSGLGSALSSLGRLCGLLAVFIVLLQFVLMGRARWLEKIFGLDNLAKVHKLNGYGTIAFIVFHTVFITAGYAISSHTTFISQFFTFLTNYEDVFKAFLATDIFIIVVFFSIYIVRRHLKYELWYLIHILTYLAVILAWGHQLQNGQDFASNHLFVLYWYALYIFVFANLLYFRFFLQYYQFFKHRFYVESVVKENDSVSSMYISGRNIQQFKVQAGQFIMVRFLSGMKVLQSHPFSVSMLPTNNRMRITIKSNGDFTNTISEIKKNTKIIIDGPYGVFTEKLCTHNKVLFIAGGIGITPIRVLIQQMAENKQDVILLYSNKKESETVFKKELDELSKKYHFPIRYMYTQGKMANSGRLNSEKIYLFVPDILERDVYLCGSSKMMESMILELKKCSVKSWDIHYENFSL